MRAGTPRMGLGGETRGVPHMARCTERREGGNPVSPGNLQLRSAGDAKRGIALPGI